MKELNLYDIKYDPGGSYRPSNGTEGDQFMEQFCENCEKETKTGACDILTATMLFSPKDPEYPKEWTYSENGYPTCTAFEGK